MKRLIPATALILALSHIPAQDQSSVIDEYFEAEVREIEAHSLTEIKTLAEWEAHRAHLRTQLAEMLGLHPMPDRTDLKATITGTVEAEDFVVEKLHYQSLPGLYVTGNFYRPKEVREPLPAVLYLSGHSRVKENGISYGNKVGYQHHPAWFVRHGYVSLVIDTIQLGEIEGLHHGTHREGMWWWNARGYTPAGVEAWNSIRALDYLQTRKEVDGSRIGVTGRSGGGIYTWWVAALDDRVKVAAPVAGITDLRNYVVDDAIEGHCDCMFMVNTYRWDFEQVAALVAPRPLLIANSDKDRIFPLDGVQRVHWRLRHLYRLYGAEDHLALTITDGPHSDTQEIRIPVFHWMNRWLKGEDPLIEKPAVKFFEPPQLKVFAELPADERTTTIHESFVPKAPEPAVPPSMQAWQDLRSRWVRRLKEKSFAGWPVDAGRLNRRLAGEFESDGLRLKIYDFESEKAVPLRLWLLSGSGDWDAARVILKITDQAEWKRSLDELSVLFPLAELGASEGSGGSAFAEVSADSLSIRRSRGGGGSNEQPRGGRPSLRELVRHEHAAVAILAPRGVGPTAWAREKDVHIRRRFVLVGQTLEGMQVWAVRRAAHLLGTLNDLAGARLRLDATGHMAGVALYAAIFEPSVPDLDFVSLPASHRHGPSFLNVLKTLDMPQALAIALATAQVRLHEARKEDWRWPLQLAKQLNWQDRLKIE